MISCSSFVFCQGIPGTVSFVSFFIRTADVAGSKNVPELALLDGWSEAAEVEETPAIDCIEHAVEFGCIWGLAWIGFSMETLWWVLGQKGISKKKNLHPKCGQRTLCEKLGFQPRFPTAAFSWLLFQTQKYGGVIGIRPTSHADLSDTNRLLWILTVKVKDVENGSKNIEKAQQRLLPKEIIDQIKSY